LLDSLKIKAVSFLLPILPLRTRAYIVLDKELALEVATDPEHRLELALALNQLDIALKLAEEANVDHIWKRIGDSALTAWDVGLAGTAFLKAKDLGSLLLVYSSTSDREGLAKLAEMAEEVSLNNVAFSAKWLLGDVAGCVDILKRTGRLAEAVLFSQTYKPSLAPAVVGEWKESLEKAKKGRVAKTIGMPGDDEDLFPEWDEWLQLEAQGGIVVDEVNGDAEEEEAAPDADDE
jgi:coatomer subunit beta'